MFSSNLRNKIKALKLTEAQVARACGLSERRFSHYVNGMREPDLSTLIAISSTLGTSPDELLLGSVSGTTVPKDTVLTRLEYVAKQLSCEDIEIVIAQSTALVQCRKNSGDLVVKCSETKKFACLKKFKHDPREPSACTCHKKISP